MNVNLNETRDETKVSETISRRAKTGIEQRYYKFKKKKLKTARYEIKINNIFGLV